MDKTGTVGGLGWEGRVSRRGEQWRENPLPSLSSKWQVLWRADGLPTGGPHFCSNHPHGGSKPSSVLTTLFDNLESCRAGGGERRVLCLNI